MAEAEQASALQPPPRMTPVRPSDVHPAPLRYLSLSAPRLRRRPAPPLPRLLDHLTSARALAARLRRRRRAAASHMADDAVAVAGAAVHCARPAHDAGCGGSDDHYYQQADVIMLRRTRSGRAFPPPISVIGKGGRPWLTLRAHREGGRLVLREMRLPSQELPLQPCREDGRFKLLIHPEARPRAAAAVCGDGGTTAGTAREG